MLQEFHQAISLATWPRFFSGDVLKERFQTRKGKHDVWLQEKKCGGNKISQGQEWEEVDLGSSHRIAVESKYFVR